MGTQQSHSHAAGQSASSVPNSQQLQQGTSRFAASTAAGPGTTAPAAPALSGIFRFNEDAPSVVVGPGGSRQPHNPGRSIAPRRSSAGELQSSSRKSVGAWISEYLTSVLVKCALRYADEETEQEFLVYFYSTHRRIAIGYCVVAFLFVGAGTLQWIGTIRVGFVLWDMFASFVWLVCAVTMFILLQQHQDCLAELDYGENGAVILVAGSDAPGSSSVAAGESLRARRMRGASTSGGGVGAGGRASRIGNPLTVVGGAIGHSLPPSAAAASSRSTFAAVRQELQRNAAWHEVFSFLACLAGCWAVIGFNGAQEACDYVKPSRRRVDCSEAINSEGTIVLFWMTAVFLTAPRVLFLVPMLLVTAAAFLTVAVLMIPQLIRNYFLSEVLICVLEICVTIGTAVRRERARRVEFDAFRQRQARATHLELVKAEAEKLIAAQLPLRLLSRLFDAPETTSTVEMFQPSAAQASRRLSSRGTSRSPPVPRLPRPNSGRQLQRWMTRAPCFVCSISLAGLSNWSALRSPCDAVEVASRLVTELDALVQVASARLPTLSKLHAVGDVYVVITDLSDLRGSAETGRGRAKRASQGGMGIGSASAASAAGAGAVDPGGGGRRKEEDVRASSQDMDPPAESANVVPPRVDVVVPGSGVFGGGSAGGAGAPAIVAADWSLARFATQCAATCDAVLKFFLVQTRATEAALMNMRGTVGMSVYPTADCLLEYPGSTKLNTDRLPQTLGVYIDLSYGVCDGVFYSASRNVRLNGAAAEASVSRAKQRLNARLDLSLSVASVRGSSSSSTTGGVIAADEIEVPLVVAYTSQWFEKHHALDSPGTEHTLARCADEHPSSASATAGPGPPQQHSTSVLMKDNENCSGTDGKSSSSEHVRDATVRSILVECMADPGSSSSSRPPGTSALYSPMISRVLIVSVDDHSHFNGYSAVPHVQRNRISGGHTDNTNSSSIGSAAVVEERSAVAFSAQPQMFADGAPVEQDRRSHSVLPNCELPPILSSSIPLSAPAPPPPSALPLIALYAPPAVAVTLSSDSHQDAVHDATHVKRVTVVEEDPTQQRSQQRLTERATHSGSGSLRASGIVGAASGVSPAGSAEPQLSGESVRENANSHQDSAMSLASMLWSTRLDVSWLKLVWRFGDPRTEAAFERHREQYQRSEVAWGGLAEMISLCALLGIIGLYQMWVVSPPRAPLFWVILGFFSCATEVAVTASDVLWSGLDGFQVDMVDGMSLRSVVLLLLSWFSTVAYATAVFVTPSGSTLGDSQIVFLFVLLNGRLIRPLYVRPAVQWVLDGALCVAFGIRTFSRFDMQTTSRNVLIYIEAGTFAFLGVARMLLDQTQRLNFVTYVDSMQLQEQLESYYKKLEATLDMMVPKGIAANMVNHARQNAGRRRANRRDQLAAVAVHTQYESYSRLFSLESFEGILGRRNVRGGGGGGGGGGVVPQSHAQVLQSWSAAQVAACQRDTVHPFFSTAWCTSVWEVALLHIRFDVAAVAEQLQNAKRGDSNRNGDDVSSAAAAAAAAAESTSMTKMLFGSAALSQSLDVPAPSPFRRSSGSRTPVAQRTAGSNASASAVPLDGSHARRLSSGLKQAPSSTTSSTGGSGTGGADLFRAESASTAMLSAASCVIDELRSVIHELASRWSHREYTRLEVFRESATEVWICIAPVPGGPRGTSIRELESERCSDLLQFLSLAVAALRDSWASCIAASAAAAARSSSEGRPLIEESDPVSHSPTSCSRRLHVVRSDGDPWTMVLDSGPMVGAVIGASSASFDYFGAPMRFVDEVASIAASGGLAGHIFCSARFSRLAMMELVFRSAGSLATAVAAAAAVDDRQRERADDDGGAAVPPQQSWLDDSALHQVHFSQKRFSLLLHQPNAATNTTTADRHMESDRIEEGEDEHVVITLMPPMRWMLRCVGLVHVRVLELARKF